MFFFLINFVFKVGERKSCLNEFSNYNYYSEIFISEDSLLEYKILK